MKFYIGASEPNHWKPFAQLIKWYSRKSYSHTYIRYQDNFTKQYLISESSKGEAHKIGLSKWYLSNTILEEYEIEVSEEILRAILTRINNRLQASYSERNIVGIPFYDLAEYLGSGFLMGLITKLFADGIDSTICSESTAFTLGLLGIKFNRPNDFLRPDHVIETLKKAAITEDYIKRLT